MFTCAFSINKEKKYIYFYLYQFVQHSWFIYIVGTVATLLFSVRISDNDENLIGRGFVSYWMIFPIDHLAQNLLRNRSHLISQRQSFFRSLFLLMGIGFLKKERKIIGFQMDNSRLAVLFIGIVLNRHQMDHHLKQINQVSLDKYCQHFLIAENCPE